MYPEKIIGAILQLHQEAVSIRGIVQLLKETWRFKASNYGVWSAIQRHNKQQSESDSDDTQIEVKRGRPSKVDDETKSLWQKKFFKNAYLTAKDIYNDKNLNPKKAAYSTICRTLNNLGLLAHRQPQKFWIGGRDGKQARLKWAQLMQKRLKSDPSFFDKVIYSDESIMWPQKSGIVYLRGPRGCKFDEKYYY